MLKIAIIGAGIGGLTAAIALARCGFKVEVFEKAPELGEVGAGLQQSPNAMAVHTALGTAGAIIEKSFEPEAGILRDYKTGKPLLTSLMKGDHETRYGYKYLNIHRADLLEILINESRKLNIPIHLDQWVQSVGNHNSGVELNIEGKKIKFDVLIGADGIRSQIRDFVIGKSAPQFTGQVAWRGIVPAENIPHGFIPFAANNWLGPKRHFVSYYLRGTRLINFVAVEERDEWTEERWDQTANMSELREAFAGWHEPVTTLLEACEESFLWGLFDHTPLPRWSKNRVTLLGDAAHPMLPFMAQGAAMAIEDGWVLAHCLQRDSDDIPKALKRYEALRKPRTTLLQNISRQNAKLYHQRYLSASLRNLKLAIGSAIPAAVNARLGKIYGVNVTQQYPIRTI